MKHHLVIEDWDGGRAIRLPDDVLQEMGVDVGDTLYLLEEYVGATRCLVLSKTPRIPDRVDELVGHWESFDKVATDLNAKDD
ncbi:TPA: AbrB/MazE/SpoVT family DNA-binding domain-containing protein [Pseudomonas aeruginosa]